MTSISEAHQEAHSTPATRRDRACQNGTTCTRRAVVALTMKISLPSGTEVIDRVRLCRGHALNVTEGRTTLTNAVVLNVTAL